MGLVKQGLQCQSCK